VQAAQDGVQDHLVDLGADPQAVGDQVVHPGQARQVRGPAGLRVDRDPGQVPQLGQRAGLHRAAVADDRDPVRQRLGLGQDVAGQQDGAAVLAFAGDAVAEGGFHQRVQAAGGLVEQEELGVAGQRGDQGDLLPVALGVGAGLLGRVELEAVGQGLPALGVQAAAQPAEQVDDLAAGQARPQGDVAGDVGQPFVQVDGVAPGVTAQQRGLAPVLAQQAEQDPDGGGLARAVRAEEGVHLTRTDLQVQAVQGRGPAERLAQVPDLDRVRHDLSVHKFHQILKVRNAVS
jgi:hypothetical protein